LTGDRGFMVTEDGKKYIIRDTPGYAAKRLYKESEWILEDEHRPLLPQQTASIVFAAEKEFLKAMGLREGHTMDWAMMTNIERAEYKLSTSKHKVVEGLLKKIRKYLAPLEE